ncbi:MAG: tRNA pseudouridine(13) synthase TruD [Candidatus Micrarchaeaceae archaeon]
MEFLSKSKGAKGIIKKFYEDFVVKEIISTGKVLEVGKKYTPKELEFEENIDSEFTVFILEKRNWDTIRALLQISKVFGRGKGAFSYAGTKDKFSVSTQLASIHKIEPEKLMNLNLKDIKINGAWKSNSIKLGSNVGNAFTVRVRESNYENALNTINELENLIPNYFDKQRFGYRLNNFKVGLHIIKNELEEAVLSFLTDTKNETDQESIEARKRLKENQDYEEARKYFPKHLKYEKMVIDYLAKEKNYANALRRIPRGISIMFIHSVESAIFNFALENYIKNDTINDIKLKCKKNKFNFPDIENLNTNGTFPVLSLIGYETKKEYIGDIENRILEFLEINNESFKIKSMPELSMKGSLRTAIAPVNNILLINENEDIIVNFELGSGSYATIFLNEITKSDEFKTEDVYEKFKFLHV